MYITFLIGNGFDINLGLKTSYSDFYDCYKNRASKDSVILRWMNEDNDKGNWADLETALGKKVNGIDEKSLEKFMDSHGECIMNLPGVICQRYSWKESIMIAR